MTIQSAVVQRQTGSGSGSGGTVHHAPFTHRPHDQRPIRQPHPDRHLRHAPASMAPALAPSHSDRVTKMPTLDVPAKLTLLIMLLIAVIDHSEAHFGCLLTKRNRTVNPMAAPGNGVGNRYRP
uniref:Uncharacterized protein n=1 Tax=Anopheles farauti TaxID=69004 RepID=A0A182QKN2_9DIPT